LFSRPGINIVNTICSLANYYSVGLEVIRTDPEYDDDQSGDNSETIDLICRCAEEGTWVLISTTKFATFMELAISNLNKMRLRGLIVNTFRMFVDL